MSNKISDCHKAKTEVRYNALTGTNLHCTYCGEVCEVVENPCGVKSEPIPIPKLSECICNPHDQVLVEEVNALSKEITNLYGDLEKRDKKIAELTEQKNNLMKQLLLEIGDGKIERDKLQATHKKEVERVFREIDKLVPLGGAEWEKLEIAIQALKASAEKK